MDHSIYEARWLLAPVFVFSFCFVTLGLIVS
jgi:hypothetical protein